jgi:small-conductance mechanosensitive channel
MRMSRTIRRCALSVVLLWTPPLLAQAPTADAAPQARVASTMSVERAGEPATLTFFNRPIVTFRARVLGRLPAERAAGARRLLEELEANTGDAVSSQPIAGGVLINVGSRTVFGLTEADVDELSGETFDGVTAQTVARVRQALNEAREAHAPRLLLRSVAISAFVFLVALLILWGLARVRGRIEGKFVAIAEQKMTQTGIARLETLRASRVLDIQRYVVSAVILAAGAVVVYTATTFILRRFPYTRPWGESMSGFLLSTVENLTLGFVRALPGLFTVALIFTVVRFVVRIIKLWFDAVERGHAKAKWIYPDTAQPTRRLVTTLLWLFAIIVAYPYMPGSGTEAFKGVSVFLGLMLTFGSSGLVNQIMSGFMVTYSRSLRVGDFVKTGDVEGTVLHVGILSTKIKTLRQEEVTVPNAVVVSQTTTDYSRFADTEGVFTPTSVTIGYDTPWRQVHSLLLLAAERTAGIRRSPPPKVLQASLEDFYVKYTLFVCLERQDSRPFVFDTLHQNIQDAFNEYGVQIMSPNYMLDPSAPKVVPKAEWFAAPARPTQSDESVV